MLRLNGKTVGEAAVDRLMGNEWTIPYAPGRIEAIAYRGGREVARAAHETAERPVALRLTPARTVMAGDGEDVQPITIDAVDAQGRHVPTANLMTAFTVDGAAIIGVGNGDPNSHEPEKGDRRSLFNGLAQIVVQADTGRGAIVVRATAAGLRPATLRIDRLAVAPRPQAPVTPPSTEIGEWRRSPPLAERPSPELMPADSDMNSWAFVRPGVATPAEPTPSWRIYRATVAPSRRAREAGGTLAFAKVAGRAELWIDGRQVAEKGDPTAAPIEGQIAAGIGPHRVALIVHADGGVASGIVGRVSLTAR